MNWLTLAVLDDDAIRARYPATRRWFENGFRTCLEVTGDGKIGLESLNQRVRLDVITGDFECVN